MKDVLIDICLFIGLLLSSLCILLLLLTIPVAIIWGTMAILAVGFKIVMVILGV